MFIKLGTLAMGKHISHLSLACSLFCLTSAGLAHAEPDDNLQFSGFARAVAGYLDEDDAQYLGYENKISVAEQSLLGLQADYKIAEDFSATIQAIARTGDETDSGIEWLYVTYSPTNSLRFKLGRQRTPTYSYSDFVDVGFAYNWVSLPQQVYRQFLFPNYDGLHAQYEYVGTNISLGIEAFTGGIDQEFKANGEVIDTEIDNLHGLVGTIEYVGWTLRAAYIRGDVDITRQDLSDFSSLLSMSGFTQSADSLSLKGAGRFYQVSAFYEDVDYFFRTELIRIDTELFLAPVTDAYFVSGGFNFYPFSVYVSISRDINRYSKPVNEIPIGFNAQLDQLAFGYQQAFSEFDDNSSISYTTGIRWDWKGNVALKAEATLLKQREGNQGLFSNPNADFDGKAMLYQVALEWVF
ncbi:hypothetical protein [uncultured Paraglaciecola sp.]|uniref:hypothetical protein n=1 Tax=uncultured Paraglaciecola sp. TaxID=1765024 RepID=UPI0030DC5713|tara:strand:- start:750 stop:1976 length:1227 start_codon:yes stop_codon:yes gene_type:complete